MNQLRYQPSLLNRIARVLLCLVFSHAVIGKLTGFAGVAGAIAAKGLPLAPVLLLAAMALMAVGSALVISGWKARLGALLLLLFLVPTTLLFHGDVADKMERIQLFKNLAILGGLLLVADQDCWWPIRRAGAELMPATITQRGSSGAGSPSRGVLRAD